MWVVYVVAFVVVVAMCFIKARFWVRQPVRLWWSFPKRHCVEGLPPTKYVDHAKVRSFAYEDGNPDNSALVAYLQTQTNGFYFPNEAHLLASFEGAYISVYGDYKGSIVSRPVDLRLDDKSYRGFFHDSMTSQETDVSRRLISTHASNAAAAYPKSPAVFCSPSPLLFLLPVVHYEIRWIQSIFFPKFKLPNVSFLKINESNINLLVEWWRANPFTFQMVPTIAQLVAWLTSKTASVYFVLEGGLMVGSFFFKNTWMVEKNKGVIDCCGAIFAENKTLSYQAFCTLMHKVRKTCPIVRLHLCSHLTLLPYIPYFKLSSAYYYLYRYKGPANLKPKECFIY
jgi:hypothetical protein